MNKAFLFILAVVAAGCSQKPATKSNQFKIDGTIAGYPDGTVVYFQIDQHQDSVVLANHKFNITDTLGRYPKQAIIHVRGTADYTSIWLEKGNLTFSAEKGNFKRAGFTGSKTQLVQDELDMAVNAGYRRVDSIGKAIGDMPEAKRNPIIKAALAKVNDIFADFIEKHPASIISATFLGESSAVLGKARTQKLYDGLTPEMKKTDVGKKALKFLQLNKDIKVGEAFADFTQYDADGKAAKLSSFKGDVILLDFWASWCGPCRQQNPKLVKIYNTYKNNGFKIVAISVDTDKAEWLNAIKDDGLPYINLSEKNGGDNMAAIVYGIDKYPTNYLIDKNGTIIAMDIEPEDLVNTLRKIYNTPMMASN